MGRFFIKYKTLFLTLSLVVLFLVVPRSASAMWGLSDIANGMINALTLGLSTIIKSAFELVILPLASGILAICGAFLDLTIQFSLSTTYIFSNMKAVEQSWLVIRDICNLFFIFALIWMSLSTILGISAYDAKRKLVQVIIAALLINFSLFFTKAVVDISNVFGLWLYGGIMGALQANGTDSLSALLGDRLGIFTFWNGVAATGSSAVSAVSNIVNPSQGLITAVIRLIVVLTATYVFVYTAILFITRAATILFLLALSPIGFIGDLLPQIKPYSKQWLEELTAAATFPIVYLMMLFVTVQFINGMSQNFTLDTMTSLMGIDPSEIFKYVLVIAMLFGSLKVAKDASGQLGKAASGVAGGAAKFATIVGGRAAALAGQYSFGAAANRLAEHPGLNATILGGGVKGAFAGVAKSSLSNVADFHFDPRAAMDIGVKPGKGYKSMIKDQDKEAKEALKNSDLTDEEKADKSAKDELDAAEEEVYQAHPDADLKNHYTNKVSGKDKKDYETAKEARESTSKEQARYRKEAAGAIKAAKAAEAAGNKDEAEKQRNKASDATIEAENMNTTLEAELEKERAAKKMLDEYKDIDTVKAKMRESGKYGSTEWRFKTVLHDKQQAKLEALKTIMADAQKSSPGYDFYKAKIARIKASMRQEGAIRKAEGVDGVTSFLAGKSEVASAINIATLGISSRAAKQELIARKKVGKSLREEADKTKKDKDREKIMSILDDGDKEKEKPAPEPKPEKKEES